MLRKTRNTEIAPRTNEGIDRWGPATDPFGWFREMDRWFDDLRRDVNRTWGLLPREAGSPQVREPAIDLRDNGTEFVVTAEMPGVSKENLEIQSTPDGLEIRAEVQTQREERDPAYYYRERSASSYHRRLPLPEEVVPDKVVANLANGVLEIRLPKAEPTPPQKAVKVKVA